MCVAGKCKYFTSLYLVVQIKTRPIKIFEVFFHRMFFCVEVKIINTSWLRSEANSLRNSCSKLCLYTNILIVLFLLIQVLLDNNIGF